MKYGFDTMAIHSGQQLDSQTYSRALPIYQTTAYGFEDLQHAQDLFELKAPGNIYSRISNPTQQTLEERVAALDGGVGALAFASGHAAICAVMLNLAACGDNIVSSDKIYGGAINLLGPTFAGMGITTTFVDTNDLTAWEAATTPAILVPWPPRYLVAECTTIAAHRVWGRYRGALGHQVPGRPRHQYGRCGGGLGQFCLCRQRAFPPV